MECQSPEFRPMEIRAVHCPFELKSQREVWLLWFVKGRV